MSDVKSQMKLSELLFQSTVNSQRQFVILFVLGLHTSLNPSYNALDNQLTGLQANKYTS